MSEIISFLKEIFLMKEENNKLKIGLSQFKDEEKVVQPKINKPAQTEVKLSDLMRRA